MFFSSKDTSKYLGVLQTTATTTKCMQIQTHTHTHNTVCNFESTGFNEIDIINSACSVTDSLLGTIFLNKDLF